VFQWSDGHCKRGNSNTTTLLLDLLADLPLAVNQASAYMFVTGISVEEYLHLCQSSEQSMIQLLGTDFQDTHRYSTLQTPIATTWLVSFKQISRRNRLAIYYLKFASFLAEKDIPTSLLPETDDDDDDRIHALGILSDYAFIQQKGDGSFDMHPLVQLAMRNWLEVEEEDFIHIVVQRLAEVFPRPSDEDREVWIEYLPHAQTAIRFWSHVGGGEAKDDLPFNIGLALQCLGKYEEAEKMFWDILELRTRVLGEEHPTILDNMEQLAVVYDKMGRYSEAEQMFRDVLELRKEVLGKAHPNTLNTMEHVATIFNKMGRISEAEVLFWEVLKIKEKFFGIAHPSTRDTREHLANIHKSQGDSTSTWFNVPWTVMDNSGRPQSIKTKVDTASEHSFVRYHDAKRLGLEIKPLRR